jgi:hypothetical protein
MELRPRLRRNYATSTCPGVYMPVLEPLGGGLIPDGVVELDGRACHGAFLELGPSSVDGWLTRIAADELGLPEDDLLDVRRRQLLVDGRRIASTGADVARSTVKPTLRHFAEALARGWLHAAMQAPAVRSFSTSSRPALRAAACGGRPRPAAP